MGRTPLPEDRSHFMSLYNFRKFVTIEPIMQFDLDKFIEMIISIKPEQVFIGADSGHNDLPEPTKDEVLQLIYELGKFTKVVEKYNLQRILNPKKCRFCNWGRLLFHSINVS